MILVLIYVQPKMFIISLFNARIPISYTVLYFKDKIDSCVQCGDCDTNAGYTQCIPRLSAECTIGVI